MVPYHISYFLSSTIQFHTMFLFLLLFISTLSNLHSATSQQHQQQTIIQSFSNSDSQWIPNQNKILVSPNSTFAAGFLPHLSSPNLLTFSIWYFNATDITTVWSANPNSPVSSSSASLFISDTGELTLTNHSSGPNLWPSRPISASKLILQETGNLVFDGWQSFAIPTNSILPGQNITGTTLTSTNGKFKFIDSNQLVFEDNPFNYWSIATAFVGIDDLGRISMANASYLPSDYGDRKLRRLTLDEDGNLRLYSFDPDSRKWVDVWRAVYNLCRIQGICGLNSVCMYDSLATFVTCICPPGFTKNLNDPDSCDRVIPISDMAKTKFLRMDYVTFTGGPTNQTLAMFVNLTACEAECFGRQNCLAFLFKFDGNNSCVLQLDSLFYSLWTPGVKGASFLRVDKSETATHPIFTGLTSVMETSCPVTIKLPFPPKDSSATTRNVVIISIFFAAELISGVFFFWSFLKKYTKYRDMARTFGLETMPAGGPKKFPYSEIKDATENFKHVIGRGAFGIVYKGNLSDGRVVAVKCLKNTTGGDADFWAEVTIIARMHHLNLVTLWGFCTEKGRRMLVYEYVANGSLDKFLFQKNRVASSRVQTLDHEQGNTMDSTADQKPTLELNIRYRIAIGIARAIAYLHEECLEWVLHCDIKPENILLGEDFCPKVSDFGLAKLTTKKDRMSMSGIRGTRGYLAPEWVRGDQQITSKSDVYSFGMVLLETVSGARNFEQQSSNVESDQWYFPMWAFDKVFKEMNVDEILDPKIRQCSDSRVQMEMVNRMVKTAIWCVQDRAEDRPSMGKVAKMLEGTVEIHEPRRPTIFYLGMEGGNGTINSSNQQ